LDHTSVLRDVAQKVTRDELGAGFYGCPDARFSDAFWLFTPQGHEDHTTLDVPRIPEPPYQGIFARQTG
jgi:hypothetical protein